MRRSLPTLAALSALAAVVPGVAAAPPASATTPAPDDGPTHLRCSTRMLTAAELAAGVISEVTCVEVSDPADDTPTGTTGNLLRSVAQPMQSSPYLAIHYEHADGTGASLWITGASCNGGGVAFAAGDFWNDRISSTEHRLCGTIKHWAEPTYTGSLQTTQGAPLTKASMNGALNDRTSSVRYHQ